MDFSKWLSKVVYIIKLFSAYFAPYFNLKNYSMRFAGNYLKSPVTDLSFFAVNVTFNCWSTHVQKDDGNKLYENNQSIRLASFFFNEDKGIIEFLVKCKNKAGIFLNKLDYKFVIDIKFTVAMRTR